MRIASVRLRGFKRFADLTIADLPASARLVVLAGPNGFGKSSLFDAFQLWAGTHHGGRGVSRYDDYYDRPAEEEAAAVAGDGAIPAWDARRVSVSFHGRQPTAGTEQAKKAFYVRTAYRNEPELTFGGLTRLGSPLDENRPQRMIEAHPAASSNYARLVSDAFDDAFEGSGTLAAWRERTIGELRGAMARLFPGLSLNGLGSPMRDPTLRFTKGRARGFTYANLSGGERAALDLLLDLVVKRRDYDATAYCIDEPELHLNPRVHGAMLSELVGMIPTGCQLWVATHAVGMLRQARDMEARAPGSVAFLDFEGGDFDAPVELRPVPPTRKFWEAALRVALDDLADLVAPRLVVVCEGNPAGVVPGKNADHDARCYRAIFGEHEPEVSFVSGGNSHDVAGDRMGYAAALPAVLKSTAVRRLIDRDDHAPDDVADYEAKGVRVLGRRNIEAYLYDDEVLGSLCEGQGKPGLIPEMLAAKRDAWRRSAEERRNPADDLKPAAPDIYAAAKRLLGLTGVGNDPRAFERSTLAPLVVPGTGVYRALRAHIFDAPGAGTPS